MNQQLAKKILETAYGLLREHGLYDWKVEFNTNESRFGVCNYRKKKIFISSFFASQLTWQETHDTILHEVAHAIVGPGYGHGIVWKRAAARLGLKNLKSASRASKFVEKAWVGTCKNGHKTSMSRGPQRVRACGKCCNGKFDPEFIFSWEKDGEPVLVFGMSPKYRREYADIMREYKQSLATV